MNNRSTLLRLRVQLLGFENGFSIFEQCGKNRIGFCISNPAFEFWLLLHFEKDPKGTSAKNCTARLNEQRYLFPFNKHITQNHFNVLYAKIQTAITHAEELANTRHLWHRDCRGTEMYKLARELLQYAQTDAE